MTEHNLKIKNPSWWHHRSRTEKCLIAIVTVLVILTIVILSIQTGSNRSCTYDKVCLKPQCVKSANQLLEKLELSANPCEDFYEFACGNFIKNTVIPEDKTEMSAMTTTGNTILKRMRILLEHSITRQDIKAFVLVKSMYQSCMNTSNIEANSVPNIKNLFKEAGGWPLVEGTKWEENTFDWISTSYKFMNIGFGANMLLPFSINADEKNSSRNALFLDQAQFGLDKIMRNGFNDPLVQIYYDYMVKVAKVFGANNQTAAEEMREVANFMIALVRITVPAEERRNATLEYNPTTIRQLEEEFEFVPWLAYVNQMLHPYKKITYDDVIIVKIPSYCRKLEELLSNVSKRTLANYMYWTIAEAYIPYLNNQLAELQFEFIKASNGIERRPPRWRQCFSKSMTLYVASGALYARNFFKQETKQATVEMVTHIQEQFIKLLKTVDWMDEKTRRHALDKAKSIHFHIAYPDELFDDQKLNNYYKNLTFSTSNYLQNALNLVLFGDSVEYPRIGETFDKKDWQNHAYSFELQASYSSSENSIEFTAGILQDPFFNSEAPKYINYGAIGHVIGHEITHGFDDEGRQYDKNGNLAEWWQLKTKEAFDRKAHCIVKQYGSIVVPKINLNINGVNTQGENIADNGGIKLAYLAYKKWTKKYGTEPVLPGLNYTAQQMFWISVASKWCLVKRLESEKKDVLQDPHPPYRYRINVALMNSKYFAEDFGCPLGSKMNPKHKCHVW